MKKIYILFALILGVCLVSCGSTPVEEKAKPEAPVEKETKTSVDEVEYVVWMSLGSMMLCLGAVEMRKIKS